MPVLDERCINMKPIEMELFWRASKRNLESREQNYLNTYLTMKNDLINSVYPNIDKSEPNFNHHGRDHVEAILSSVSELLSQWLSYNYDRDEGTFSEKNLKTEEIFVLLIAILWHDVPMIEGRAKHSTGLRTNIDYFSRIYSYIKDEDLTNCIIDIACSHGDEKSLSTCANNWEMTGGQPIIIHQKALASILRFCDEMSDNKTRVDEIGLKQVIGTESEIFWRHSESIKTSSIKRHIETVNIEYLINDDDAFRLYKYEGNNVELYDYILYRINKVYWEFLLCEPLFRDFCSIRKIEIKIGFKMSLPPKREYDINLMPIILDSFYHSFGKPVFPSDDDTILTRFPEISPKLIKPKIEEAKKKVSP